MTRAEAGRRGDLATHRKYGSSHMAAIGRKGFRALVDRYNGDARAAREHLIATGRIRHRNRQQDYWREVIATRNAGLTYDQWERGASGIGRWTDRQPH